MHPDVLLLVDSSHIRRQSLCRDFERCDWSNAWRSTLEQEVGCFCVREVKDLAREDLERSRLVVASSSAASGGCPDILAEWVDSGGMVIIEKPGPGWEMLCPGIERPGARAGKITMVSDRLESVDYRELLKMMPLCTFLHPTGVASREAIVWLEIDGVPAIREHRVGGGRVIVLAFNYGLQLISLQQGVPRSDFSVRERRGRVPFLIESDDLAASPDLLDNPHPYADILERLIFSIVQYGSPLPRWWSFPSAYTGAFLMTHDEEKLGGARCLFMADEEEILGVRSTFFIISDSRLPGRWRDPRGRFGSMRSRGFDMQFHWDRFNLFCPPGEQLEHFLRLKGEREFVACRIHFLNWGNRYSEPFRIMAERGIDVDSSLGPNRGRGYLFGTGLPFFPLAPSGECFPLREIPFLTQENWEGANEAFFRRLFTESRERHHQCIVSIFHPHKTVRTAAGRDLWLKAFAIARDNSHWIATFSEYFSFYENRSRRALASTYEDGVLTMRMGEGAPGMGIIAPLKSAGRSLDLFDGCSEISLGGEPYALLPVPAGACQVIIRYR